MISGLIKFISISVLAFILVSFVRLTQAAVPGGNYLELNGGYVKAANPQTVSPQSISFEIVFNPSRLDGERPLLTVGSAQNNALNYQLGINGGGVFLKLSYGVSSYKSVVTGQATQNTWQTLKIDIDQNQTLISLNGQNIHSSSGALNLRSLGPDIYLGNSFNTSFFTASNFFGSIDRVSIRQNDSPLLVWELDSQRGYLSADDSSGNNINGNLVGGDSKIHYFGVLPTPTKYVLPTLPALPQISFSPRPGGNYIRPTVSFPSIFPSFEGRPVYPR